jgi:energy-coupling factor transporter transmembrane protein EcfT
VVLEMKPLVTSLLKRNTLVALVFFLLLSGIRAVPRAWVYMPPFLLFMLAYFCSLVWANRVLVRQGHPVLALLLSVVLFPILGFPIGIGSMLFGQALVEAEYSAQGLQMVDGCNGGAAGEADGQVHTLRQRLDDFVGSPGVDTNVIAQLQTALVIAQEKARILSDDCARRGHCETHPWKTNWAAIRPALAASEKLYQ